MLIEAYTRGVGCFNVCEQEHTCSKKVFVTLVILTKANELKHENRCEWFSVIYGMSVTTIAWYEII